MKGATMIAVLIIGLMIGIGVQDEYNVTNKAPQIVVKTKEKIVKVQSEPKIVEKIVKVPVEKKVIIYKEPKFECKLIRKD